VSKFDEVVTALGTLADQAVARFATQQAAATALAGAMRDSVTAMREAAVLAQQLQAKYVEQTVMLDAATGSLIEDWSCNRTAQSEVEFSLDRWVQLDILRQVAVHRCAHVHARHHLTSWRGGASVPAGSRPARPTPPGAAGCCRQRQMLAVQLRPCCQTR
jgi:hypothetical protein